MIATVTSPADLSVDVVAVQRAAATASADLSAVAPMTICTSPGAMAATVAVHLIGLG